MMIVVWCTEGAFIQNCSKIVQDCSKLCKNVHNCSELFKIVLNCSKLYKMVQNDDDDDD